MSENRIKKAREETDLTQEDIFNLTDKHNALQKAILEEFAPRFAPGAICLYVGDTTNKNLVENQTLLKQLGLL